MEELKFFLDLQINKTPRGILIYLNKYTMEILKFFEMEKSKSVTILMLHKPKLDEDKQGKPFYATRYRSMIGSLMYLTSSKLDIHFDFYMCSRYQSRPTEKHITAVKTDLSVSKWNHVHGALCI